MEEIQFNHTLPIQLRFNDVDKFGHVNNTVYFSFYDLGKTEYFASVCPDVDWEKDGIVVVHIEANFLAQIYGSDHIAVQTAVTEIGTKSFHLAQRVIDTETQEIKCICTSVMVTFDLEKHESKPLEEEWIQAITNVLKTFKEQQRKDGVGPYKFQRKTERALDTVSNDGLGAPVKPVGLIVSSFRPSDDATTLQFLVPSNFFAVSSLRKAAEILEKVNKKTALSKECKDLAQEVETALKKYAVYNHPKYGKIYAFEVDGFGNHHLMDDANVPSLLAMPYLGDVNVNDPIYQNTRRFVWSEDNPYFFKGKAGEGIGGPHIGYNMVWPMSIMMKAFTSQNDAEIKTCIKMLMDTDADTGFMHESFHKDNPKKFTRAWFAWQNTLFGELILKLVNEGKVDLLNSIQ